MKPRTIPAYRFEPKPSNLPVAVNGMYRNKRETTIPAGVFITPVSAVFVVYVTSVRLFTNRAICW